MRKVFSQSSIQNRFIVSVGLMMFLFSCFTLYFFPTRQRKASEESLSNKGQSIAQTLAINAAAGVEFEDRASVVQSFESVKRDSDVRFVVVWTNEGQQFASYARLSRPVKESAGKRTGRGNGKMGNAYLKWAFSEAIVVFLRETRESQSYIRRMERKYGKDKTKGILAHRLGRAVYSMLKTREVFDLKKFVNA